MSQAPVNVSPLIKLARWSMLTAGIFYGAYHQKRLSAEEAIYRENESKMKVIRDAQLSEERKKAHEDETRALAILSKPRGQKP